MVVLRTYPIRSDQRWSRYAELYLREHGYIHVKVFIIEIYSLADQEHSSTGAVAELFDLSCMVNTPMFATASNVAFDLWSKAPASMTAQQMIDALAKMSFGPMPQTVVGQHYFGASSPLLTLRPPLLWLTRACSHEPVRRRPQP